MKEMFSKVTLPSGMEIHQEGPQWVLVSKDGKQRTDVTDVMNTIDKYNREVDAANEENRMQNEAQSSVDKAADANTSLTDETIYKCANKYTKTGKIPCKLWSGDKDVRLQVQHDPGCILRASLGYPYHKKYTSWHYLGEAPSHEPRCCEQQGL